MIFGRTAMRRATSTKKSGFNAFESKSPFLYGLGELSLLIGTIKYGLGRSAQDPARRPVVWAGRAGVLVTRAWRVGRVATHTPGRVAETDSGGRPRPPVKAACWGPEAERGRVHTSRSKRS